MLEKIIDLDKKVFIYLNGLGSETYDGLWLLITKQIYWTPFFLLIFYFLQKKLGWKNFLYYILFTAVLILICDQTANFFKNSIQRLRPCNDMATTVFAYLILKKEYKYSSLLFLFPFIFAYSRIYLGLHFPTDILTGYAFGAIFGCIFYKMYQKYIIKN